MPKCHKFPFKKKAVTECFTSKYLCTATRDLKLVCLLLLTTTLRAEKINICVSLGPSLIWKPETNIETLKSPDALFLINYQWLHLAGWAAEGSNVRPGYFRAPSSQPWAQTVLCTILPGSCSCPAVIPPFHPSTNTKYLAVTLHMDPKAGEPEEMGGWKEVWTEQVYTISWPSLLVLHEGITSVGMKTCCGYGEESLAQERSTLETRNNDQREKPNRGITVLSLPATHRLMSRQHLLDGDTTRTSEMSHGQRQKDFFPFFSFCSKVRVSGGTEQINEDKWSC